MDILEVRYHVQEIDLCETGTCRNKRLTPPVILLGNFPQAAVHGTQDEFVAEKARGTLVEEIPHRVDDYPEPAGAGGNAGLADQQSHLDIENPYGEGIFIRGGIDPLEYDAQEVPGPERLIADAARGSPALAWMVLRMSWSGDSEDRNSRDTLCWSVTVKVFPEEGRMSIVVSCHR